MILIIYVKKAVYRSLLKRIKKIDRNYIPDSDNEIETPTIISKNITCPLCHEGVLKRVKLANREWEKCNECEHRTKARKL